MPYYTYIIHSQKNGKYYIGSSEDPEVRLKQHNWSRTPSIKSGIPWKLVYIEEYMTRSEAVKREYEIKKKKSRKYIIYLIQAKGTLTNFLLTVETTQGSPILNYLL